jgi:hypothetical protein
MIDVLNSLVYIAGIAALTPVVLLIIAILACNLWDFAQAAWGAVTRAVNPTNGWWPGDE